MRGLRITGANLLSRRHGFRADYSLLIHQDLVPSALEHMHFRQSIPTHILLPFGPSQPCFGPAFVSLATGLEYIFNKTKNEKHWLADGAMGCWVKAERHSCQAHLLSA